MDGYDNATNFLSWASISDTNFDTDECSLSCLAGSETSSLWIICVKLYCIAYMVVNQISAFSSENEDGRKNHFIEPT